MRYRLHKLLYGPVGSTLVEQLDRGPTTFDDQLRVDFLRGELVFTRLNEAILVQGRVDTAVKVQCVRSLEDFDLCITVPLDDILFSLPQYAATEPDRQISDDGWIDLTETLREEIIMAIPINPINPKYAGADASNLLGDLASNEREWLTVRLNEPGEQTGMDRHDAV
jgi:uncharacterized metal-binding protein YceD (DUF177 family)